MEIAIKVCRQASPEDALLLAQKHSKHEWYLRIQIEDKREFKKALEYIATLEFEEVSLNLYLCKKKWVVYIFALFNIKFFRRKLI